MADDAEFRITIRARPTTSGPYPVEATFSGAHRSEATYSGTFVRPFDDSVLDTYLRAFRAVGVEQPAQHESPIELARTFGVELFSALINQEIASGYHKAQGFVDANDVNLRITLSLTQVPELAVLPWEFVHDGDDFLAISTRTPIVRSLDVPQLVPAGEAQLPLRILAVVSKPKDAPSLDTGKERRRLNAELKPHVESKAIECDWLDKATIDQLNARLRDGGYHILHFIGHGGFSGNEGVLLFENADGFRDEVDAERLARYVGERTSVRLVVLNACDGAHADVGNAFASVAGQLINRNVPAVIGMQFPITNDAAVKFASSFYAVLARDRPIDTAVSEARLAMDTSGKSLEWATPALYLRGPSAKLFEITRSAEVVPVAAGPGASGGGVGSEPTDRAGEPSGPGDDGPTSDATPRGSAGPSSSGTDARPDTKVVDLQPPPHDTAEGHPAPPPISISQRIKILAARRPLLLALLMTVGVIAVIFAVAWVLIAQASKPSLSAHAYADRPDELTVTGSGFRHGESVDLLVGDRHIRIPVDSNGQFTTRIQRPPSVPRDAVLTIAATGLVSGESASTRAAFAGPGPGASPGAVASPASIQPGGSSPAPSASAPGAYECQAPGTSVPSILFYSDRDEKGAPLTGSRLFCIDPETGSIATVPIVDPLRASTPITYSTWAPKGMDIALTSGVRPNRDIQILRAGGSLESLSSGTQDDSFPAWSIFDDFAFIRDERGTPAATPDRNSELMLMRPGDPVAVPLLAGLILRAPAWSPDGTKLAFFGHHDGRSDFDIAVIDFGGLPVDPATIPAGSLNVHWFDRPGKNEMNPSWSPDGSELVFVRDGGLTDNSDNDIFVAGADLSNATRLTGLPDDQGIGVQDGNPVWSPDGTQIVFYRATKGGGYHLWLMSSDGNGQHDLMPTRGGENMDPSWR